MKKIIVILFTLVQISLFCQNTENQFVFTDTIQSKFLNKNIIIHIYLPPNFYNSNDTYPLQVVLGNYSRTHMYYSISEYLSLSYQILELNQLHSIPETIVVGVGNPNSKNMNEYEKFITQEIIPLIDKNYRKCNFKAIIGHSRGGELVLRSMMDSNSPFNAFYCSAPSNSDYFIEKLGDEEIKKHIEKSKKRLFFAASQQDYFYKENVQLINAYNEIKSQNFLFKSIIKTSDTHHTIFPVTITDGLFAIFKDWEFTIPEKHPTNLTESFLKHYKNLSETIGLEINPPEFDFYLLAYILNEKNQIQEKIILLKKCKDIYPKALNADAYLARTYYSIGDLKNAKIYNDQSLLINPNNEFALSTKELIDKEQ